MTFGAKHPILSFLGCIYSVEGKRFIEARPSNGFSQKATGVPQCAV
jgi:hypothetical protein